MLHCHYYFKEIHRLMLHLRYFLKVTLPTSAFQSGIGCPDYILSPILFVTHIVLHKLFHMVKFM
jgi:hypothetical protein